MSMDRLQEQRSEHLSEGTNLLDGDARYVSSSPLLSPACLTDGMDGFEEWRRCLEAVLSMEFLHSQLE